NFPDGSAQLVDQVVVLHDIAIRAGIESSNGGFNRGNAGDEQKHAVGSDFLGQLEQLEAGLTGHADIRNHNVENLRLQLSAGRVDAGRNLNLVTFYGEGDLEEFTDGAFVIHDENVHL